MTTIFVTLGPPGTCHEQATRRYIQFHGLKNTEIKFVDDFLVALEWVREGKADFIIQNSAHPKVYEVTEKYCKEVFVIDTFLCPTKEMAVLTQVNVVAPKTLGLMPATKGYMDDLDQWGEIVLENSKPLIGKNLLAGKYDSGLTHIHYALDNPDKLRVDRIIGSVDTAWLTYGRKKRCQGNVIGLKDPELFA